MTHEKKDIENIILGYLQDIYPQSVVAENISSAFLNKIGTRITKSQVENVLEELEQDDKISIFHSKKINKSEIKALGSKETYEELDRSRERGIEPAAHVEEDPFFFLETVESLLQETLNEFEEEIKDTEQKFLNRMIQSFGIIAAIFAFIISVLGYSSGIFDIFNTVVESGKLEIWESIFYLGLLSLAIFLPIGILSIVLIWFVKKR